MSAASARQPRHLRVPRQHGEWLTFPELPAMPNLVARNRAAIADWNFAPLGRSIHDVRAAARREAVAAAQRYTEWLDSGGSTSEAVQRRTTAAAIDAISPLIVSGHQPELFHCGVWVKNFLLHELAASISGIGLNLIIDNDAISTPSIGVPVGDRTSPHISRIPFAEVSGSPPWEEVVVYDRPLFRSFAERVTAAISGWSLPSPMLAEIWPVVCALLDRGDDEATRLADALTAARRSGERSCGLNNLELPMSHLAELDSFAWFVVWLLSGASRLRDVYNSAVESYRRQNGIHGDSHPVPNLVRHEDRAAGDRQEVPLWIWRSGESRRSRLFVRDAGSDLQLFAEADFVGTLPHPAQHDPARVVAELRSIAALRRIKIRPRALTNTLFARVFLGDTFLHGIGGAKYDEITNELISRLCGIAVPPDFLTATATFHLPLSPWPVSDGQIAQRQHDLWDFDHNPERFVSLEGWPAARPEEVQSLLAERRKLIAEQQTKSESAHRRVRQVNVARYHRLCDIRHRLFELARPLRQTRVAELQQSLAQRAANAVLASREFAFCLFPKDLPRHWLEKLERDFQQPKTSPISDAKSPSPGSGARL